MDANPDIGKPYQQWALAQAVMAAARRAADDFRTEILHQRSSDPPAHEIKAVRMVRDDEKAWCRCGAEMPVERNGAEIGDAVAEVFRQHLAELQGG
jgi:hypothetical protein